MSSNESVSLPFFHVATQRAPLFLFILFLTAVGLVFHVMADWLQTVEAPAPPPLMPLLATGAVSSCFSVTLLMVVVKRRAFPRTTFRWFEPFEGGDAYNVLQIVGFLALGLGLMLDVGFWRFNTAGSLTIVRGIPVCAGVLLAFATAAVGLSLDYYTTTTSLSPPTSPRTRQAHAAQPSAFVDTPVQPTWHVMHSAINRSTAVVLIVVILGNGVPLWAALTFPLLTDVAFAVQLVAHVFCAAVVHFHVGWTCTPKYRLFMPFPGGNWKVFFTQGFAWLCFGIALIGSLFVIGLRRSTHDLGFVCVGVSALSLLSMLSLLLFVRMLPVHAARESSPSSSHRGTGSKHVAASLNDTTLSSSSIFVVKHGKFTMSAVAVVDTVFLFAVGWIIMYPDAAATVWNALLTRWLSSDLVDNRRVVFQSSADITDGLVACQVVGAAFLLLLPPLTHSIGAIAFPQSFDLWAPFTGPKVFIALQAVGWCTYTTGIICGVLAFSVGQSMVLCFAGCIAMAQLLIHASLHVFAAEGHDIDANRRKRSSALRHHHKSLFGASGASSAASSPLNGELLLAVVITAGGIALRIIIDVSALDGHERLTLLWFSMATFVVSSPLAHWSMRTNGARMLSPFTGPVEYVALQSVGWTLYALLLIGGCLSIVEGRPMLALAGPTTLSWSVEGFLQAVPFTMVILSAFAWCSARSQGDGARYDDNGALSVSASCTCDPTRTDAAALAKALQRELLRHAPSSHNDGVKRSRDATVLRLQDSLAAFLETCIAPPPPSLLLPTPPQSAAAMASARQVASIANVSIGAMCVAEIVLFGLAAHLSSTPSRWASATVLAAAGAVGAFLACGSLHGLYGPIAHPGTYRLFMPFRGGISFVVLQASGWGTFSAATLLVLAFLLREKGAEPSSFGPMLASAGILSAAAQVLLLKSIPLYDSSTTHLPSAARPLSMLELHAEGAVAGLLFVATLTFRHIVGQHHALGATLLSPIAVLVSAVCISLAIPLGFMALEKAYLGHRRHLSAGDTDTVLHEDVNATPKKKVRSSRWDAAESSASLPKQRLTAEDGARSSNSLRMLEYILIPISVAPVTLIYVVYFAANQYTQYANALLSALHYVYYGFMVITMLSITSRSLTLPLWLVRFRVLVATCTLYMIPTLIVLPTYVVPLFYWCRATILWAIVITLFTIIPAPFNRKLIRPGMAVYLAYWIYQAFVDGRNPVWIAATTAMPSVESSSTDSCNVVVSALSLLFLRDWRIARDAVVDIGIPVFWFLYSFTYSGFPEEHGRRRSTRFIAFFKRNFYDDAARYFSLRVIASSSMRFRMKDPAAQFFFGFHPHGVFPATAMYIAETDAWRHALGYNEQHHVTVHGASIIFSGPILRDVVMALGGRSVTRRSIENSVDEGHSVMLVPGGQAELVLTACCTKQLHLVTHHLGMVRLAIKRCVPLVPIVSLNENNILDTVHCYRTQRWFLRYLSFPFPLVPMGLWGLPLPNSVPLTVVIGDPVDPAEWAKKLRNVHRATSDGNTWRNLSEDTEFVAAVAEAYFSEVRRLFEAHKAQAGLPDMKLFMHHGLPKTNPRQTSQ